VPKTAFVHIGVPAAGGSFLPRQLQESRETLRDAGIAVLERPLARSLRDGLVVDCPTVVFSGTGLAGAPAHRVARVLETLADHHVQVIYGMPDFGAALVAEWQRHVLATARTVSLAVWIKELASGEHQAFWRAYGLRDVFGRWTVPPGDVHVIVAPRGSDRAGALWTRFASVLGASTTLTDRMSPFEEPLDPEQLELLRRVHALMRKRRAEPGVDSLVRDAFGTRLDPSSWPCLPQDHRAWIVSQVALQRAWLESSSVEIVGDLDDLELDERRFDTDEALPDEQRLVDRGVDVSALLVERLIRGREQGGPAERRDGRRPGGAGQTKTPRMLRRARGLASSVRTAAPSAIRRRGRSRPSTPSNTGRPTYYLHIGAPKCGSSYLQRLLWKNRPALMRDGVYVPGRSQPDHFWAGTDFTGREYVTQAPGDRWRGAWDRLIDDAERSGYPKVVITSEFLSGARVDQISARLGRLGDANVHVVYAIRDLAGLLGSIWQQGVQVGPAAPWLEWLEALAERSATDWIWARHDPRKMCEWWAAGGADEIDVIVLPRPGGAPDELWRRFQAIVGWNVRTSVDARPANESLGYSQAEFLRRLQHRLKDVEPRYQRARVTKTLIANQFLRRTERVDTMLIPEQLRAWLETESVKRRDELGASCARIVGDPDDLLVVGSRFSPDPPNPSEAVMVDAAVNVIERLAAAIRRTGAPSGPPNTA
jgi:hypothetical protein